MFTYDIVLTLGMEIEKVWQQRISAMTVLWFLVCMYSIIRELNTDLCLESLVVTCVYPSTHDKCVEESVPVISAN